MMVAFNESVESRPAESPEQFIKRIYAYYQQPPNLKQPDPQYSAERKRIFSKRFVAALERDERCTPEGDVGFVNGMLLINAQDFGDRGIGPIAIEALDNQRYAVRFELFPEQDAAHRAAVTVTLSLVRTANAWRIDDVDGIYAELTAQACVGE
jgi:hypothetical protein